VATQIIKLSSLPAVSSLNQVNVKGDKCGEAKINKKGKKFNYNKSIGYSSIIKYRSLSIYRQISLISDFNLKPKRIPEEQYNDF